MHNQVRQTVTCGIEPCVSYFQAFLLHGIVQVSNVKIAEHLSQGLQECSRVQEIIQCSGISGSDGTSGVVHEFEIELEQLQSKVDHLKAQVSCSFSFIL